MIDRKMSQSTHTSTFTKNSEKKYKPTFTKSPTVIGLTLSRSNFLPFHILLPPSNCTTAPLPLFSRLIILPSAV